MQTTSELIVPLEKILMMTEMDAFEAKLPESPLEAWFPDYEGERPWPTSWTRGLIN